ncbi:MAG: hypothetical protein U5K69_07635 [Balneolaceae bacterium]|nr:hypothetical protein [Balneolaceae bacterium]
MTLNTPTKRTVLVTGETLILKIQVKRNPSFVDYVPVVAPVLSSIATGFLIIERLR